MRILIAFALLIPSTTGNGQESKDLNPHVHKFTKSWAHPFLEHLIAGRIKQAYEETTTAKFRETVSLEDFQKATTAFDLPKTESYVWGNHDRTLRYGRGFIHARAQIDLPGGVYLTLHAYGVPKTGTEPDAPGSDNYLLESFEFQRHVGAFEHFHFAPPEAECQKLAKDTLLALARAKEAGNYGAFREVYSGSMQEEATGDLLENAFAPLVGPFDLAFLDDAKISIHNPRIDDEGHLIINNAHAISESAYRDLQFQMRFLWENSAWKLLQLNLQVDHHGPPIKAVPPDDVCLAMGKRTLAAWKEGFLKKDFAPFVAEHGSTHLQELMDGGKKLDEFFVKFHDPKFGVSNMDVTAAALNGKPEIDQRNFVNIFLTVPIDGRTMLVTFGYYREKNWVLSGLNFSDPHFVEPE